MKKENSDTRVFFIIRTFYRIEKSFFTNLSVSCMIIEIIQFARLSCCFGGNGVVRESSFFFCGIIQS